MNKHPETRRYKVDLSQSPKDRWKELLADRWALNAASQLSNKVYEELIADLQSECWIPGVVARPIAWSAKNITSAFFKMKGMDELDYDEDIDVWSKHAIGDKALAIFCNLRYELYQLTRIGEIAAHNKGLCTSTAFWLPDVGMVHARNMDWPIEEIRRGTILIDFKGPSGEFSAVTMPGYVGVLSGVAKGRFSATINSNNDYTDEFTPNWSGWAAAFLLRWIFEYCSTYEEALKELKRAHSFSPFFVQLVGPKKGQACVVSVHPSKRNKVYSYNGQPLAVANHHPDNPRYEDEEWKNPDGTAYVTDSIERLETIRDAAAGCEASSLKGALAVLRHEPVLNEDTMQSMVFHPESGSIMLNAT